jgi:phosphoglycerate dehydrogenase-like enzyme
MPKLNVVVWDNIGNTMLGMRAWDQWDSSTQERLLTEDPDARSRVVSFDELFADQEIDLVWLYDPIKSQRGFRDFFKENRRFLRPVTGTGDLMEALADAEFMVLHKEKLPPEALDGAARLRLIQHLGSDYRGMPVEAARARGIPAAATPLVNYSAVAEHLWATILAHLKRLPDQRAYMESGDYQREWGAYHPGVQIVSDLTLGLLGMGEIARPVARVAQAFGMNVIYWDIERFSDLEERYTMAFVEWDEIFSQSDVLSVQLALNDQTMGIIGARELGLMKPTALFSNTARGKLVDEAALVAALESNTIGGAALDVYTEEPLPLDSPLHALHRADPSRVILTPHSAAQGPWTWIRDSQELWKNVRRVLDGEPIRYAVA